MDARRTLLLRFHRALDNKDVEGVAAALHPEADVPNQLSGGRVVGAAAILDYYSGAFALLESESTPTAFRPRPHGAMEVRVHHHVTNLAGALWHDGPVDYSFSFRDGLIVRMDRLGESGPGER
jgi:hypothetical protein